MAHGAVDLATGLGVFDRHLVLTVGFAPGCGPAVQPDLGIRLAPPQLGAQEVAEQPVVPIPLARQ